MAERNDVKQGSERSSDQIRQDIAAKRGDISDTVDRLGERIHEKLDWRGYVMRYPYWSLGAAAGVGFLTSRMMRRKRSPIDRIGDVLVDTVEDIGGNVRNAIGGVITKVGGRSLVKGTLYGMATKLAIDWLKNTATNALRGDGYTDTNTEPHSSAGSWASNRNPEPPRTSRPV